MLTNLCLKWAIHMLFSVSTILGNLHQTTVGIQQQSSFRTDVLEKSLSLSNLLFKCIRTDHLIIFLEIDSNSVFLNCCLRLISSVKKCN